MNNFPVILICRNSDDGITSYPARIVCTSEQYENKEYEESVCEQAAKDGFIVENEIQIPYIAKPEDPIWETFSYKYFDDDWANAPLITLV